MNNTVTIPENSRINDKIVDHLNDLITYSEPRDFRNRILHVYLQYVIHKFEELPIDFQEIALDFNFLIDFFNRIDTELKAEQPSKSKQK